jgi:hypothetical protein
MRSYLWIVCVAPGLPMLGCTGVVSESSQPTPRVSQDAPANPPPPAPLPVISLPPGADVSLHTASDADARRRALIRFLWGSDGFPSTKLPASVDKDVPSPVAGLSNVARVDTLHFHMDPDVESFGHHFIALDGKQNRLVIVHQGHSPVLDDDPALEDSSQGMQRTINNLLVEGYSVLALYMPGCLPPGTECSIPHAEIVETPTTGNGIKFFLEPVAVALNYLQNQAIAGDFAPYQDFAMVGLSGGGWTTTVCAAIDPRITLSIPVAGSLPLPMRTVAALGDEEQTYPGFYALADYPDLYTLGAYGPERAQVQVLNRHDNCCFGDSPAEYDPRATGQLFGPSVHAYEIAVRRAIEQLGSGSFRLEIDEAAPAHMISWNTIASVILPELRRWGHPAPVGPAALFDRGSGGNLVRNAAAGLAEDTGIPIIGRPAWSSAGGDEYDVFARDPENRLVHGSKRKGSWTTESLGAVVITDPVMVDPGVARFDVAALTTDYLPGHWWSAAVSWSSEAITEAPRTFGIPQLTERVAGQLHLLGRDWTHARFLLRDDGPGEWTALPLQPASP